MARRLDGPLNRQSEIRTTISARGCVWRCSASWSASASLQSLVLLLGWARRSGESPIHRRSSSTFKTLLQTLVAGVVIEGLRRVVAGVEERRKATQLALERDRERTEAVHQLRKEAFRRIVETYAEAKKVRRLLRAGRPRRRWSSR